MPSPHSPCEVTPEAPTAAASMAELMMNVDSPTPTASRGMPGRLIPAVAGGTFAALLLVVLGCTPLFRPASAKAAAEQPIIVKAPGDGAIKRATVASGANAKPVTGAMIAGAAPSTSAGGTTTIASASAKRGGVGASSNAAAHGFTVECNPPHESEDSAAPRPENVALQGIMAGQNSRAALLDGVLYREGDRFGSHVCPWTIAMIDVASVRIEKAFGDRTCGVTIRFQQDNARAHAVR